MRIHRKYHSFILILYLMLFSGFLFLLPACTPEWVNKITKIRDVIWYSIDPKIEILMLTNNGFGFGYIENNNIKVDVSLGWGYAYFCFNIVDKYGNTQTSSEGSTYSIDGNYNLINDSEIHLNIYHDTIFKHYENTVFILKSKKVNQDNIDAIYQINVYWKSIAPNLTFKVLPTERRRGKGVLEYNNTTNNIIFYWEDDSKFSVYELKGDLQSESPILTGTYTSSNMKATLTIEDDLVFNHEFETIELVAKGLNDS